MLGKVTLLIILKSSLATAGHYRKKKNSSSLKHPSKQTRTRVGLPAVANPPPPCCSPVLWGFSSLPATQPQPWAAHIIWWRSLCQHQQLKDISQLCSRAASGDPASPRGDTGCSVRKIRSHEKDMAKYVKWLHSNAPVSSVFGRNKQLIAKWSITPDKSKSLTRLKTLYLTTAILHLTVYDRRDNKKKIQYLFFYKRFNTTCHKTNFTVFSHVRQTLGNRTQIMTHALIS